MDYSNRTRTVTAYLTDIKKDKEVKIKGTPNASIKEKEMKMDAKEMKGNAKVISKDVKKP